MSFWQALTWIESIPKHLCALALLLVGGRVEARRSIRRRRRRSTVDSSGGAARRLAAVAGRLDRTADDGHAPIPRRRLFLARANAAAISAMATGPSQPLVSIDSRPGKQRRGFRGGRGLPLSTPTCPQIDQRRRMVKHVDDDAWAAACVSPALFFPGWIPTRRLWGLRLIQKREAARPCFNQCKAFLFRVHVQSPVTYLWRVGHGVRTHDGIRD